MKILTVEQILVAYKIGMITLDEAARLLTLRI